MHMQSCEYLTSLSFPCTDRGTVQKVIVLPKDPTTMEELTLEEVEVFRVNKSKHN